MVYRTIMESYAQSTSGQPIYPVYILKREVDQLINYCYDETPKEALGILDGWQYELPEPDKAIKFSKVVDWVTGEVAATHVGAQFTSKGLQEYNLLLDERYGKDRPTGPYNIGIFHSHPFGHEPHFSSVDYSTFLNFPYNAENNVFILIDPVPERPFFKVFHIRSVNNEQKLLQVPWVEYSPVEHDFQLYTVIEPGKPTEPKKQNNDIGENTKQTENNALVLQESNNNIASQQITPTNTKAIDVPKEQKEIIELEEEQKDEEQMKEQKVNSRGDPFFDLPVVEDLSGKKRNKKYGRLFLAGK